MIHAMELVLSTLGERVNNVSECCPADDFLQLSIDQKQRILPFRLVVFENVEFATKPSNSLKVVVQPVLVLKNS